MTRSEETAPLSTRNKPKPDLWKDSLGRTAIRAAQILLILVVAVVVVFALLQIRLLVIPVLVSLILAAAIGPFVNMLRRRGWRGGLATAVAFLGLLIVLGGVVSIIVLSVRSQWDELISQAAEGLDELENFLLTGPFPWIRNSSTKPGKL